MNLSLTDFNRGFIVGLKIGKVSTSEIERILQENQLQGCQKTINRIWDQWVKERRQTCQFKGNSGRKPKLTEESQLALTQYLQQNGTSSRKELQSSPEANPQQVSGRTLTNFLNNNGFNQQSVKQQIYISETNKQLRIAWARSLLKNRRKDIYGSIYSDESWLYFKDQNKSFKWVNENVNMQKGCKTKERWPQKCMVWGAIHKDGAISLKFVEGNLNSAKYYEILLKFYLKYGQHYAFTCFQQDNAPAHSSEQIRDFFKSYEIKQLPWASQSPDINPIERVWSLLKYKLSKQFHSFQTFQDFKRVAKNLFLTDKEIQQLIKNSIESIPNNLMKLIEKQGNVIT
ncbi:hypothetical protein ABPG72_005906 [Tetrahymena utriculariae]